MTDTTLEFESRARPASRQGSLIGIFAAQVLTFVTDVLSDARRTQEAALNDASAVRRMAHRYRQTDRGFAADLDAAADRHETSLDRPHA